MSPFVSDADVGFEPPAELLTDLDAGFGLDESNYGSVAARQIEKRRDQAKAAGSDLNQNEQVAIMDAYRQAAGLEPMTYNDTFAETNRMIAERQSGVLNLARSTSAAFQNQAVNFVSPAMDLISPGWGTKTRANIAALNPYDPSRLSGKAGGAVAAAPLLLAGGSAKAAAAVFGMNSAADSLARSEDTGVEGLKKWGGAAGSGAITAGAILAGGKLAQWAGKTLGTKIPHLKYLISHGRGETIGKIIGREASLAGISLPTQGTTMLAGTIADNLLAQKTTDPNRKWDDGLGDTAFNVAALTLSSHIARAGAAAAMRGPAPTAMVPSSRGQGAPDPGFVQGHTIKQAPAIPGQGTTALAVRPKGTTVPPTGPTALAVRPKNPPGTEPRPPAEPDLTTPDPPVPTRPPAEPGPSFVRDETGNINLGAMGKSASKALSGIVSAGNAVMGEMSFALAHAPAGQSFTRSLDQVSTKASLLSGKIQSAAAESNSALSRQDRNWLMATDDAGYSNFQRIIEDTPSGRLEATSPEMQAVVDTYQMMLDTTGEEAVRIGVQAKTPTGEVVDFKQAAGGRFLRSLTSDAHQALIRGSGPLFDGIAAAVARDNDMTLRDASDFLKEWLGPKAVRKSGSMEQLRAIPNLPSAVSVEGKKVTIQELDPYRATINNGRNQARRIYMIEEFGQGIGGEPTKIDRLRAKYQSQGGDTRDFDDVITVFEGRPYKRVFADPRNPLGRAVRVADRAIATAQTSMSVVPNIPQTLILVPKYVGAVNYAKAIGDVLRHPKTTVAQLTALGAMNQSFLDFTVRPGYVPEDIMAIIAGSVSRFTGLEAVSQFNNAVAGRGFERLADSWRIGKFSRKDMSLAQDLRLTPKEIRQIKAGEMTQETYAKIVQNGVKITQFVTENPHRRSKLQNIPFWNGTIAYANYAIGTGKAVLRAGRETARAFRPGATAAQRGAAAQRLAYLLIGGLSAGTISLLLRRGAKGQEIIRADEDMLDVALKGLWEASLLGPTQRMQDAFDYGGTTERAVLGISPKVSAAVEVLKALRGDGTWGQFEPGERAKKLATGQIPLVRGLETWWHKLEHPQIPAYSKVRGMAGAYRPKESKIRGAPIKPAAYRVHEAILRDEPEELQTAMVGYRQFAVEQGWDEAEGRRRLRSTLMARRPVNFNYATYREFLHSLPPEKRMLVEQSQAHYVLAMDELTLTPAEQAARAGDLGALAKELPGLPVSEAKTLVREAMTKPIARKIAELGIEDALRVWEISGEKERKDMRSALVSKFQAAKSRMTPTELNALAAQFRIQGVFKR